MGHLKNKYTKEYYTGKDVHGNKLKYGATSSVDQNGNYILRDHDYKILRKIDFENKNVLALGCGRGEELAYAIENGANIDNSVGVDFATAAIKIAKELFRSKKLKSPKFYTEDALDFVANYSKEIKNKENRKFDIVIMFDFVEHVPRKELIKILKDFKEILRKKSILVVNTPAYKYDNDAIKDGYDNRNQVDLLDTSDSIPETQGMHCNKYSILSLQDFMGGQGFVNVTEAHYYIYKTQASIDFGSISYLERWKYCKNSGFGFLGDYSDDFVEIPYPQNADIKLMRFRNGGLDGISLFLREEYKKLAYPDGNTDKEMMDNIHSDGPKGKVIFDVGSFIGASSLVFSTLVGQKGKVVGFEPNPFNRNRSFLNIANNPDLSDRIRIYPFGLGSENRKVEMLLSSEIDNGYSSTSRIKGSHAKLHDSDLPVGFEEVIVDLKKLDDFVKEYKIVPDIIKVDIEGAEYDFLVGAEYDFLVGALNTVQKYKPIFYIEIHSEFCAIRCFDFLRSEGYIVRVINEEEDNRIMIKAEYVKGEKVSINDLKLQAIRNQDATLELIKEFDVMMLQVRKEFDTVKKICELENVIERLTGVNAALEKRNSDLAEILSSLENSKSWKVTKPIRAIMDVLRKDKLK